MIIINPKQVIYVLNGRQPVSLSYVTTLKFHVRPQDVNNIKSRYMNVTHGSFKYSEYFAANVSRTFGLKLYNSTRKRKYCNLK